MIGSNLLNFYESTKDFSIETNSGKILYEEPYGLVLEINVPKNNGKDFDAYCRIFYQMSGEDFEKAIERTCDLFLGVFLTQIKKQNKGNVTKIYNYYEARVIIIASDFEIDEYLFDKIYETFENGLDS